MKHVDHEHIGELSIYSSHPVFSAKDVYGCSAWNMCIYRWTPACTLWSSHLCLANSENRSYGIFDVERCCGAECLHPAVGTHTHRRSISSTKLITIRTLKVEKFRLKLERPSSWRGNVIYKSFPLNPPPPPTTSVLLVLRCHVCWHIHCAAYPLLHLQGFFFFFFFLKKDTSLSQQVSAIRVTPEQL